MSQAPTLPTVDRRAGRLMPTSNSRVDTTAVKRITGPMPSILFVITR
jgi:hypothetical protein